MDLVESYREELRFARKPLGRGLLLLFLALLIALPLWGPRAWLVRGSLLWLTAIGVLGQNLLLGYAGQVSFGQSGFLAVGAYAFAHLRILGVPFVLALPAAGGAAAALGLLVGLPSLRLKGPYLAIATLGFGTAVSQVFANLEWLSGGRAGLHVPQQPAPFGLQPDVATYWIDLGLFLLATAAAYNLVSSWVGRALVAVRDADVAAEATGISLLRTKLLAFAVSSFYTGVQGALFAQYLSHLEPQSFSVQEVFGLFVAIVVGGLASVEGSAFGAAFVVLVPPVFGELRWAVPVVFGAAILAVLIFEPLGLAGLWLRARLYFRNWPFR